VAGALLGEIPFVVRTTCVPPENVIVTVADAVNTAGLAWLIVRFQVAPIPSTATVGPLRLSLAEVGLTV